MFHGQFPQSWAFRRCTVLDGRVPTRVAKWTCLDRFILRDILFVSIKARCLRFQDAEFQGELSWDTRRLRRVMLVSIWTKCRRRMSSSSEPLVKSDDADFPFPRPASVHERHIISLELESHIPLAFHQDFHFHGFLDLWTLPSLLSYNVCRVGFAKARGIRAKTLLGYLGFLFLSFIHAGFVAAGGYKHLSWLVGKKT